MQLCSEPPPSRRFAEGLLQTRGVQLCAPSPTSGDLHFWGSLPENVSAILTLYLSVLSPDLTHYVQLVS